MNFRDLNYLVSVADLGHFGKAAEKCCVSQPTLSAQLKKLEEELQIKLFERNNKQVLITPAGKSIIAKARILLRELNELKEIAQNSSDPLSGKIHLGFIPTLGPYLLPHILNPLHLALPKCTFYLSEEKTQDLLTGISDGRLDAIFLALPIPHENLVIKPLFEEPFYLALPRNHPLTKVDTITNQDLKGQALLLLEEGHCLRDQALEVCKTAHEENQFRATSLETLKHMVAMGSGITLLPSLAKEYETNKKDLILKPFKNSLAKRSIVMAWRKMGVKEEANQLIADTIIKIISSLSL